LSGGVSDFLKAFDLSKFGVRGVGELTGCGNALADKSIEIFVRSTLLARQRI